MAKTNIKIDNRGFRFRIYEAIGGTKRISIECLDDENDVIAIAWHNFSRMFNQTRVFPLGGLTLPKVVQYYSSKFEYNGSSHCFFFKSMNPKEITYKNELDDDVTGITPWTHLFVLLDLDNKIIVDSTLFFSETQIKNEFQHSFYVPNIDNDYMAKNDVFENLFGISQDLYSYSSTSKDEVWYDDHSLPESINTIWLSMMQIYFASCSWDTPVSSDVNILDTQFMKFTSEHSPPIEISVFEDFSTARSTETLGFYDILKTLYDEHLEKVSN